MVAQAGGSGATYEIRTATPVKSDYGSGVEISSDSVTNVVIIIRSSWSGTLTFKPMIRPASITDSTFQPYAKTNRELTVAEGEDRAALIEQVDAGAKNLLRNTASSQVVGGVTFTVNADGTITANGTKTNNDWFYLSVGNSLDAGAYVLSSGLAPQSDMSLRLLIATEDSLGSAIMSTEGGRQVHTKQLTSDYTGLYYAIRISSGTTVNNVVFKPMICTAADWAVSQKFVPYAPTNRELYESKADKSKFVSSISSALDSQTDGTICGYVGSSSTIPNVSAEYIVARTYTTDNSLDRRIQIVESAGGARESRYYNGTSWGSWTPA